MRKTRRVKRNFRKERFKSKKLEAAKKEVTLEEVAKLLDEFFDELGGSFDRIGATLDRMIDNSRRINLICVSSNRSLDESLGRLESATNSIRTYPVSSKDLIRRPTVRLINGADLRRVDLPPRRRIF